MMKRKKEWKEDFLMHINLCWILKERCELKMEEKEDKKYDWRKLLDNDEV